MITRRVLYHCKTAAAQLQVEYRYYLNYRSNREELRGSNKMNQMKSSKRREKWNFRLFSFFFRGAKKVPETFSSLRSSLFSVSNVCNVTFVFLVTLSGNLNESLCCLPYLAQTSDNQIWWRRKIGNSFLVKRLVAKKAFFVAGGPRSWHQKRGFRN